MDWVTFDGAYVVAAMPAEIRTKYDTWSVDPAKAARFGAIVRSVLDDFRTGLSANPTVVMENGNTLPERCLEHVLTVIFYHLALDMGLSINMSAQTSFINAQTYMRQLYTSKAVVDGERRSVTPSYRARDRGLARILAAVGLLVGAAAVAWAGGFSHSFGLGSGSVVVSNSQANSSWVPVSVMFSYTAPSSGTAAVWRISQGREFKLGSCAFTNVGTVVWAPEAAYSFAFGDALRIESSVTGGVVQVTRRGD